MSSRRLLLAILILTTCGPPQPSAEWACAGAITQCEYFESFEDEAHGLPGFVENPCRPEFELAMDECN
jgi:hypothetical protein